MASELYGFTNKVMAGITAKILSNEDLCKFLYYTDFKYRDESILKEKSVDRCDIIDSRFFSYRRVPERIDEDGAYMFIDIYRNTPITLGGAINEIYFDVYILVHIESLRTYHGNRAFCMMEALNCALNDYVKTSIGKIDLVRIDPMLGLEKNYTGYCVRYRAYSFNTGYLNRIGNR